MLDNKSKLDSFDYREFNVLKTKYNFIDTDSDSMLRKKIWFAFNQLVNTL